MYESKYQAARLVSAQIKEHFAHHLSAARERGDENLAPEPDTEAIEAILDAAFWASLRKEEGHATRISIAYLSPEQAEQPLIFTHKLELTPEILTKLSPGVERPGVYLGVWQEGDRLYIWGTTTKIPYLCFILDVSEPGLLVIKHRRANGFGKFTNVAVLSGDQIKMVNEQNTDLDGCPIALRSLLGLNSPGDPVIMVNPLIQLAVSMRAHQRGGTLLVVPSTSDRWWSSLIHPVKYSITPPYTGLAELMRLDISERTDSHWQALLRTELESLAGLTAVDGATVINDRYELMAFGAKIGRTDGNARVEKMYYHEPVMGAPASTISPAQSGGTRHLSAAQFVHDQRDSLALVASQDGHFTVFAWLPGKEMVQAYRIDSLLL
ncbi:MAG TPA: hypothetical protein VNB90_02280 [Cytophagaceae bacterium]|jgi:hypothetical protein|nr:hypothetical protein [Cytophagaceae bacterium]